MFTKQFIFLTFIFTFAVQEQAKAESLLVSTQAISLQEVLEIARRQNPDILAERKNWESMSAKVRAVKSWQDPEVTMEFMGFPRNSTNVSSAMEKRYSFAQVIPFPGKLHQRGKAAQHDAQRSEKIYQTVEQDVIFKVKESFFNLLYADYKIELIKQNTELMRRFAKVAESKYATGKAMQADVLRAQTELAKMLNMSITSEQEREMAQAELNALLGRSSEEPIGKLQEPRMDVVNHTLEKLQEMALEHRPEVHAAQHHIAHMRAELSASKADYMPDTMLQYTWRTVEGMDPDAMAMIKFNLPFVWFWRQGSVVKSTSKIKEHADAMLRSTTVMARYQVKQAFVQVQTSARMVELYRTSILPQAELAVKVSAAAFESGRSSFLELLDSERALIQFQTEYYQQIAQYGIYLAQLERAVGKNLER